MDDAREMTKEEAITILYGIRADNLNFDDAYTKDKYYAVDMAIKALEQEPKTVQEKQAESEKYQKAFDDGYENGYSQARFDYEQEPCEDAISRQAVIASIKNLYPDMPIVDIFGARQKWLEKYAPYFECENAVEQLPSVKQEPKTGRWIVHEKPHGIRYLECPYCNIWYLNEHLIRNSYCPNCGARMIEPQERSGEE